MGERKERIAFSDVLIREAKKVLSKGGSRMSALAPADSKGNRKILVHVGIDCV